MEKFNREIRVYLVDDEQLATKRLRKLLAGFDSVTVVGSATDPAEAVKFLNSEDIDLLFLDIQMPGLNGFDLLFQLDRQPIVIFTTAYENYSLKAFEVNSIDYLLKPIEPAQLERSIEKFQRFRETGKAVEMRSQLQSFIASMVDRTSPPSSQDPSRIPTRVGDRILFLDLKIITHFFSEDKVTFAATSEGKRYIVDQTLTHLEQRLDAKGFLRIHRGVLANLAYVEELFNWFAGRMRIKIRDKARTELTVSRNQVKTLKERLGL